MAGVVDRWHLSRPPQDAPECAEHPGKVASRDHGCAKRWQARWRDDAGRQCARSFERKGPADAFLTKTAGDLARGEYVDPAAGRVTLRAYAEQWRSALVLDPVSVAAVTSRLTVHVYPLIGDYTMATLAKRPSLIQQWIKRMESELGLAPRSIRDTVGWVSTIFRAAVDDGVVSRNPCAARSVRRPRLDRKKAVPWTLDRVKTVAKTMSGRLSAMVYLGAGCGHRQGELFGIAVDDVDFMRRVVHVNRQVRGVGGRLVFSPPKGGKTRTVPLPDAVALELSAHIKDHKAVAVTLPWKTPDGDPVTHRLLFTTPTGGAWERNRYNELWRAVRDKAKVPAGRENGTHVLRHTAASAWLAAGVDIRTVAEYLGHSDPGFTLRTYAHMMPDAADRARRAMDAFFAAEQSARVVHGGGG